MHSTKERQLLAQIADHMQSMGCRCVATSLEGNTWNGQRVCDTFRCANVDRPALLCILSFLGDGDVNSGSEIVRNEMKIERNDELNRHVLKQILRNCLE